MGMGEEDGTFVKGQNNHKNTTCTEHVETSTAKWQAGSKVPGNLNALGELDKGVEIEVRLTRQV
jgi:hypothetical protein